MNLTDAQPQILDRLAELLGVPAVALADADQAVDLVARVGARVVAVEFVAQAGAAHVGQAIARLQQACGDHRRKAILVVAVPFMGPVGQRLCSAAQINWLDLSGNAHLVSPDLRIHIEGKANRFKAAGRPPDLFAPMRSRVARHLLFDPTRVWRHGELLEATGLDAGYFSRTLRDLADAGLVHRDEQRRVSVPDPNLLLGTWHDAYDLRQHHLVAGHLAARSGDDLVRRVTEQLRGLGVSFALTGLPAAWQYAPMAMFRMVSVYVADPSCVEALEGFRADPSGANLWLLRPSDRGVLDGLQEVSGLPCVSPVQVYLDLKAHPERANEAAEELRRTRLTWSRNA